MVTDDELAGLAITESTMGEVAADAQSVTIATLGIGETATITAEYVVTEADAKDLPEIYNKATAKADPIPDPSDPEDPDKSKTPEGEDEERNPLADNPSISVKKSVLTPSLNGYYLIGQKVEYQFVVSNTGNVTLYNIQVTDSLLKNWNKMIPELKPGASETFTYFITISEDMVGKNKTVINTASAESEDGIKGNDTVVIQTPPDTNGGNPGNPPTENDFEKWVKKSLGVSSLIGIRAGNMGDCLE